MQYLLSSVATAVDQPFLNCISTDLKIPSLKILEILLTFLSQSGNAVTPGKKVPNNSLTCYIFRN